MFIPSIQFRISPTGALIHLPPNVTIWGPVFQTQELKANLPDVSAHLSRQPLCTPWHKGTITSLLQFSWAAIPPYCITNQSVRYSGGYSFG
jgi:hypothetical protein